MGQLFCHQPSAEQDFEPGYGGASLIRELYASLSVGVLSILSSTVRYLDTDQNRQVT